MLRITHSSIAGLLILVAMTACNEPKAVVEQEWSPNQPKLIAYYIEMDGKKVKVKEEKFYVDGNTQYIGEFDADGKRHGEWRYYYEMGNLWSLGNYDHGSKTGKKEVYWPDGKLRYEGYFSNDQKSGHWIFYKENGTVHDERDFGDPSDN